MSPKGISESERHNTPFRGAIIDMEYGFPPVTFLNLDKMVSVLEIDFGEELSPVRTVKEVGDAGKQVMVFLCDFIEALEIDTKLKEAIFLLDE